MLSQSSAGAAAGRAPLRKLLSYSTYTGLVPLPATFRPFGISALVIAKNEEEWAETSVLSVMERVDEIVLGDHGSEDATREIFGGLAREYPDKVRLVTFDNEPFHIALNSMLALCRFQWILRFNADFVARTSGPHSLEGLAGRLRGMDRRRYFTINLSGIALDGDLHHQYPGRRDPFEPLVFTYSPWLRYGVQERWESLHVPWFYEKLAFPEACHFHMRSVKSTARMMQKLYWSHWYDAQNKGNPISLRDFIKERAQREWGGSTVEEAAKNYVLLEFQGCVPYSRELCGEYPEILVPALESPPFRLVFDHETLVDRIEGPRFRPGRWRMRERA